MELSPKVQKIIDWRESLAVLPDSHFFEIIRMYLGEVKTPFNKQKLIEELGAFIRKEESRRTIVSLLSETDLQLICAVKFIPNATEEKLAAFFGSDFTFSDFYSRLLNLEERLIIYRHKDKLSGKMIISLNPHLEDDFAKFAKKSVLLKVPETVRGTHDEQFAQIENFEYGINSVPQKNQGLSPELIAAFVAFINKNPDLCKADGTFKKRISNEIGIFFPGKSEMLFSLTKAFINLSLLSENLDGYEIDTSRFLSFSRLAPEIQYAYLAVSSHGRFSRGSLVRQAKLLLDVAESVPETGFSRSVLLKLSFLIAEDREENAVSPRFGTSSRFSEILNRAKTAESAVVNSSESENLSSLLDRLLDVALSFGIFRIKGTDSSGEDIFARGNVLDGTKPADYGEEPKVLSIDAGFNVTLMPGLPLEKLLPLMSFMELVQFDTAALFEINRKSAMHGFDAGFTSSKILELLRKYSPYEVPQNLEVSLDDWSNSYSSAAIYKGYVLQVSEKNASLTEKNPVVQPFISAKLAEGIYLLSVENDEEASALIEKSGLDFIGKIKTAQKSSDSIRFPEFEVSSHKNDFDNLEEENSETEKTELSLKTNEERARHFEAMRSALEKMTLTPEQKEGLLERIEHKIILSPVQLRASSVKFERIEAGGMDFSGKLHIIEGSISNNSMVELHFDNGILVGVPISVSKTEADANVLLEVMPEHEQKLLSIGQAKFVKRIRGSVLR